MVFYLVKLRISFRKESELKNLMLTKMTPKEFCNKIFQFSEERKSFAINIARLLGDIVVMLQRTNLPE
jgi:hypothetical protein